MSAETRKDIEAEIGRTCLRCYGWRLVGKIAVVVLVPTIGGFFWLGSLASTVESHIVLGGHESMETRMSVVQAEMGRQDERLGSLREVLQRIEKRQDEIVRLLRSGRRYDGP